MKQRLDKFIHGRFFKFLGAIALLGVAVGFNLALRDIWANRYLQFGMYRLVLVKFQNWFPVGILVGIPLGGLAVGINCWIWDKVSSIERIEVSNVGWIFLLVPGMYFPGLLGFWLLTDQGREIQKRVEQFISTPLSSQVLWMMMFHLAIGVAILSITLLIHRKYPELFDRFKKVLQSVPTGLIGWIVNSLALVCLIVVVVVLLTPRSLIQVPESDSPNVIIIGVDTLRADHMSTYGYDRRTTPGIDEFAEDATLFEHAYSTTSWTIPAFHSLFTGLYIKNHRVRTEHDRLDKSWFTLSEILSNKGYRTEAVISGVTLKSDFGFDQGFDRYDESIAKGGANDRKASQSSITADKVTQKGLQFLKNRSKRPFFLFLHYWDPHGDYIPPSPYDQLYNQGYEGPVDGKNLIEEDWTEEGLPEEGLEEIVGLYDGEIRWTDAQIQVFLEQLRNSGLYSNSIIVFTADHGEEFFEHGQFGHGNNLYNESVRVPLIIKTPGENVVSEVPQNVSLIDVVPTILDQLNYSWPVHLDGKSLLKWVNTENPSKLQGVHDRVYLELRDLLQGNFSVVSGSWKYITVRQGNKQSVPELYDLEQDPSEMNNLVDQKPSTAKKLRRALENWRNHVHRPQFEESSNVGPDPETYEQLRGLGYIE